MEKLPPSAQPTALVVIPHADDAAAFCGGTIARRVDEGWRIVLVRVTDDWSDSVGLTRAETVQRNYNELREAAEILGVSEIVELGYPTDSLADVSRVELRERFVYLFRRHRPYAVYSFDPYANFEPNLDHVVTAQAVEEAYWVACFDQHHPEHFEEGLLPFSVCERWYFARRLPEVTHAVDVTDYMERRVKAFCAHDTMVANILHQAKLQLATAGRRSPLIEAAITGDKSQLLGMALLQEAAAHAQAHGLGEDRMAEVFRMTRFGGLEDMLEAISEPLD
ncbi:MAG: hypothetical protein RLZZ303_2362 [Candidatus Hydrogenedentota bacterium]|jgi:LmbE family N-acetylglucosaminyl deacetylase